MIESLCMLALVWGGHVLLVGLPVLIARTLSPHSLRWRNWESLHFVLPFWVLIFSQGVYPTGGMSNWLIEVGILTAGLFLCLLARVASPPFRTSTVAAACLLFVGCLAAVVIHVAVPPLPD
jgi:hypothetical protein